MRRAPPTLYTTLEPRFEEAYRISGTRTGSTPRSSERLPCWCDTVSPPRVPIVYKGALNVFADPRLEQLTAAEKQFLRIGPRNMRLIQGKLREIAAALGMRSQPRVAEIAGGRRSVCSTTQ